MNETEVLKRRSFLKSGFLLSAAAAIAPGLQTVSAAEPLNDEVFKIIAGPYLQTVFNNSVTVHWVTNKNANSWVEFGTDPGQLSQKAYGRSKLGLKPEGRINKVTLKGLVPDQKYYYRVVSTEIKDFQPYKLTYGSVENSAIESFVNTDPSKKEISFLMLNDIHDRPRSIPHLLNLDTDKEYDFVFFNGDIFDYQTDEKQIITNMLQPCVDTFARNKPFIYVRGNHETRGKFRDDFADYFENVGQLAFTLGPARFVILDSGEDKEDSHPVYANLVDFDAYRLEQAEWLKQEMQTKAFRKAAFRVVMMHIPPRFSGNAHGAVHCTKVFDPLLNSGKVDMVLCGHTHSYKVHQPAEEANKYPLVIGGGPKEGNRTLTKVKISEREIKMSMLDDSGKQVGSYTAYRR